MEYKVLVDTCVDFNDEAFGDGVREIARVPFTVTVDDEPFVDRGQTVIDRLNSTGFAARMIRTASPSPGDFIEALNGATKAFIITISSHLSGSYSAAMMAGNQMKEEYPDSEIHVLNSETASAGETMVAMKLLSLLRENLPVNGIIERINQYISELKTLFVLESMDTLVANGRVRAIEGMAIKALKICPIMGDDGHGKIELKALSRGKNRAFARLVEMIGEGKQDFANRVLGITHVNALEKAQELKRKIEEKYPFKAVVIFEAGGLSSVYASDGGIVVAF